MTVRRVKRKARILDFDIENRPLSYWYGDACTAEITSIAASWYGQSRVFVWLLGVHQAQEILTSFHELYDEADIVTGHYIRAHDLPIINGAMMELGLSLLGDKMTHDTKLDMVKKGGISASQETMIDMVGAKGRKHHMSQAAWREANRLTPSGIEETRVRVTTDVRAHKSMRLKMIERGMLKAPRMWRP